MLVTLLFSNALCLEALPIYLSKAVSEAYAILFSVIGVLVVGEIIPQALCTGPQ
jgi:metal transporter CNNM